MSTTLQAEASRRNGALSNGPVSDEGKAASRANSIKHGLSGAGAVLAADEADEVARREVDWTAVYRPTNAVEAYLVRQCALESVRVERCQKIEHNLRIYLMMRAADLNAWDEDRRLEAEEIGARLARDPARAVRRLRQTAQGADWLSARWDRLAKILDSGTTWNESQRSLALDLLGIPETLRTGPTPADPAEGADPAAHQRALALAKLRELYELRERVLLPRDVEDRHNACRGIDVVDGATRKSLRLIRRYESESHRRMQNAMKQLTSGQNRTQPETPTTVAAIVTVAPASSLPQPQAPEPLPRSHAPRASALPAAPRSEVAGETPDVAERARSSTRPRRGSSRWR